MPVFTVDYDALVNAVAPEKCTGIDFKNLTQNIVIMPIKILQNIVQIPRKWQF
jgi:hypothetical protein